MSLSFDLQSSGDCLREFERKVGDFKGDSLNTEKARDCAIAGWHICDWVHKEHGARLGYNPQLSLQNHVKTSCPELGYLQDVANSRKHKWLTYTPSVSRAYEHEGAFSPGFSRGFDISRLMLELGGGAKVDFQDVLESALSFWVGFFKKHGVPI